MAEELNPCPLCGALPCDWVDNPHATKMMDRPAEPEIGHNVRYRGWECGYDVEASLWGGEGWRAYKGGADIDAPTESASTFNELLDAVDDREEDI